ICVAALNDQPVEGLRVTPYDPENDWPAVILDVQTIPLKTFQFEEFFHHLRYTVERVIVGRWVGYVARSKSRIVRCDHVEAIGKRSNKISILMRARRKTVKQ